MAPRKVHFSGHGIFWFQQKDDGDGPLALLEHCDDDGEIVSIEAALSDSYAHVSSGEIKRFGKVIGKLSDLVDVKERLGAAYGKAVFKPLGTKCPRCPMPQWWNHSGLRECDHGHVFDDDGNLVCGPRADVVLQDVCYAIEPTPIVSAAAFRVTT